MTWMFASPALVASEVMYLIPQAPLMACSSGMITDSVSVLALAPGYEARTITIGGAIVGNCEVGSVLMASTPMKIMTSENTMASTGRFKNLLNIYNDFWLLNYSCT